MDANFSTRGDDWEFDEARLPWRVEDALRRLSILLRLCPENTRYKCLRIPVVQREPRRLNLHHDPMAGQKDVVRGGKRKLVRKRLVRFDRLRRLEAFAIAAAEDVAGNHELVSTELWLRREFVGVDVDELHDPVCVGTAGRRD